MEKIENTEGRINIFKLVTRIFFYILMSLLIILFGTISYLSDTWKELSFSEILFHLKTSIEGTNPEMIISALLRYGLPALICFIVLVLILEKVRKTKKSLFRILAIITLLLLLVANALNLYRFDKNTRVVTDFINSVRGTNTSDFIEKNYVDPANVSMKFPEQKRNLIYIYLESMEATYSDKQNGGAYSDNYIPRLTKLSEENEDFQGDSEKINGGIVLPGTNWTTAALFAQTSGLPLQLPVDEGEVNAADEFFPQITTLGDILAREGYTNIVEMGSSAGFGGITGYYTKHGNYQLHDYDYAIKEGLIPKDYYEFWGYEDEKLLEFAKKDITKLAKEDKPFNYTMFTIDTHFEDGYVCRLCDDKFGDNQYANVIACSDKQVSDFVRWIQKQSFYENTTIVITGDHTTMDSDFCADISKDYQRKTYTCIINSAVEPQIKDHREFSTIDLFPTILGSLGVEMSSDMLGTGTNLYGTEQTLIEKYGKDFCVDEYSKGSKFVESLAKVGVDEKSLESARKNSYLEVAEENGFIRFRLQKADKINYLLISDLKLKVHNNKTNEDKEYNIDTKRIRTGWVGVVHSDIPYEDVSNLDCEVYISVDDYENYLLLKATSEEFEQWNINWDMDE
jgi:phosphoglycerol transferase